MVYIYVVCLAPAYAVKFSTIVCIVTKLLHVVYCLMGGRESVKRSISFAIIPPTTSQSV